MDRRRFLDVTAGAIAGCAFGACASLVTTPVTPQNGVVRLQLRNYPRLEGPGGYLKILPDGASIPLYVLSLEGDGYAVLSPICTHLRCTVNIEGASLVCPCHGSMFDRSGKVLQGPAERDLLRVPAAVTRDGVLEIDFRSAG